MTSAGGRTEISARAVAQIAGQAAGEVPNVRSARDGGGPTRRPGARVHDGSATVRLDVAIDYPLPVLALAARIRQHVAWRVSQLTGLAVSQVNLTVTSLYPLPDPCPLPEENR